MEWDGGGDGDARHRVWVQRQAIRVSVRGATTQHPRNELGI